MPRMVAPPGDKWRIDTNAKLHLRGCLHVRVGARVCMQAHVQVHAYEVCFYGFEGSAPLL